MGKVVQFPKNVNEFTLEQRAEFKKEASQYQCDACGGIILPNDPVFEFNPDGEIIHRNFQCLLEMLMGHIVTEGKLKDFWNVERLENHTRGW